MFLFVFPHFILGYPYPLLKIVENISFYCQNVLDYYCSKLWQVAIINILIYLYYQFDCIGYSRGCMTEIVQKWTMV